MQLLQLRFILNERKVEMKKLMIGLALVGASLLSACTTLTDRAGDIARASRIDESALYAVEAAYNAPAHAYVTADGNGQLTPALKAQIKPVLLQAYDGVIVARCAYSYVNTGAFPALPEGESCPASATTVAAFTGADKLVESLSEKASALIPD